MTETVKFETSDGLKKACFQSIDSDPVRRILGLLGDVVLIAIRLDSKKPVIKGWQGVTRKSMTDYLYLESLKDVNIGVLLGKVSGGLCTIDIDRDDYVESFLASNARLRDTTRTKRVRGCNLWIYVIGDYPRNTTLKAGGEKLGEWRADGNQTIIYGRAIAKGETKPTEYRFLNEIAPVHIRFDEIVFPEGCFKKSPAPPPPIRLNPESCITTSLDTCIPASLHSNTNFVLENIKAKNEAMARLKAKSPGLERLYHKLIESRFHALANARNDFVVQAVTFLYRAIAPTFILELVGCFYDCNRALFNDPREQHMKEAKAMLESVTQTYAASLAKEEQKIYDAVSEDERNAFRICRDLALLERPERRRGEFYLAFGDLGDRLGIYPTQAQRIMRQLAGYGLIRLKEKGKRRAPGVPALAGFYECLLLPQETHSPVPAGDVAASISEEAKK